MTCDHRFANKLDWIRMYDLPDKDNYNDLPHITEIDLSGNFFSGSLTLKHLGELHDAIFKSLNLSGISFCGTLELRGLPYEIETLNLSDNRFEGDITLNSSTERCHMDISGNTGIRMLHSEGFSVTMYKSQQTEDS